MPASDPSQRDRFWTLLALLCGVAVLSRIAYVGFQAAYDPWFLVPVNDGQFYVDWASRLAEGSGEPGGAYYLAPLYPLLLSVVFLLLGPGLPTIYVLQQCLSIGTAVAIATRGRKLLGDRAALVAATLFAFHHPLIYFASRLQGETLAILFLVWAVVDRMDADEDGKWHIPFLMGLATLARPNLLLVALLWIVADLIRRRWRRAILFAAIFAMTLAPVAMRNYIVSGHLVPVSANGGLTLQHGNGPGAVGRYTAIPGMSADVNLQRSDATRVASLRSGKALDDVEADGWWGRQAVATRLADPIGSMELFARRILLTTTDYEIGLESWPSLDPVPARWVIRGAGFVGVAVIPFALLLGLSISVLLDKEYRRRLTVDFWIALFACLLTPLIFYVSSRYRLPFSALLCLSAGVGIQRLRELRWRWGSATTAGAVVFTFSLLLSLTADVRLERVAYHRNASHVRMVAGDVEGSRREALAAVLLDDADAGAHYGLGVALERTGDLPGAMRQYRVALDRDPYFSPAGESLARLLVLQNRADEAVAVLEEALQRTPTCHGCWQKLLAAWVVLENPQRALDVRERIRQAGFEISDDLQQNLDRLVGDAIP